MSLDYFPSDIQVERTPAAAPVLGAWSIPAMVMGSLVMLCKYANVLKKQHEL